MFNKLHFKWVNVQFIALYVHDGLDVSIKLDFLDISNALRISNAAIAVKQGGHDLLAHLGRE